MNFESLPQRKSAIHKVVADGARASSRDVARRFEDEYTDPKSRTLSQSFQKSVEMPWKAEEVLEFINQELPNFLREYGLESRVDITPEHFEQIKTSFFGRRRKDVTEGFYSEANQKIAFETADWEDDPWNFAACGAHEQIHMQAFQSVTLTMSEDSEEGFEEAFRRTGLVVIKEDGTELFNYINEAITEELTKRFIFAMQDKIPYLNTSFDAWLDGQESGEGNSQDGFRYYQNRQILWKTIGKIYQKRKDEGYTEEDIFKMFSRAALNGNLLPLARIMKKSFGKGAMRELATIQVKSKK